MSSPALPVVLGRRAATLQDWVDSLAFPDRVRSALYARVCTLHVDDWSWSDASGTNHLTILHYSVIEGHTARSLRAAVHKPANGKKTYEHVAPITHLTLQTGILSI